MTRRKAGDGMAGARIHVLEQDKGRQEDDDIPSNDVIGDAVGTKRSNVSVIAIGSLRRLQLRMVTEHLAHALPTWSVDQLADLVAFAVEHRMGGALCLGELSVDEAIARMHNARKAA